MFGRRREKHARTDVSLIQQFIQQSSLARIDTGRPVPYDELPITVGVANLIADGIAAMDMYAVDRDGQAVDQRFPILEQPNPEEDRADTLHKIVQSMFWTGNAYGLNTFGPDAAVMAINILNPNTVSHIDDPLDDLRIDRWTIKGGPIPRQMITLWKLNDDPRRGPVGQSPLTVCSTALGMYGYAYKWIADTFAFGGNPTLMFRPRMELPPGKIAELVDEWVSSRAQGRPPFLPTWLETEGGPGAAGELAAAIDVLDFAAAEIARLLTLPVTVVNAPVKGYSLTYANVGEEFKRWLAFGLGTTWVSRIERGFTRLLPAGLRAHLDPSPLFPTDLYAEPLGPDTPTAALPPGQPALASSTAPAAATPEEVPA